jgi:hypothetical protein
VVVVVPPDEVPGIVVVVVVGVPTGGLVAGALSEGGLVAVGVFTGRIGLASR